MSMLRAFRSRRAHSRSCPCCRARTIKSACLAAVAGVSLLLAAVLVPLPYVIESPGPTFNLLSEAEKQQVLSIEGARTYPTAGQIRMVTVNVKGGPQRPVSALELLAAYFNSDEIIAEEQYYPPGITREQIEQQGQNQMDNSRLSAQVAALDQLGDPVRGTIEVTGVIAQGPSERELLVGDEILGLRDGQRETDVQTVAGFFAFLAATPPQTLLDVRVRRKGKEETVQIRTAARADGKPGSLLGIYISARPELPYKIDFSLHGVGGPSAGLPFALAILDKLTPEELTRGISLAATGTIDYLGQVGKIGGVSEKMRGAARSGAQLFLLPQENCGDVKDWSLLRVVPVATLEEALSALSRMKVEHGKLVGGDLPSCPQDPQKP